MAIKILFGTETGNAEMVADDLQEALAPVHSANVQDMANFRPTELTGSDFIIIVCSTYGDGELPGSAQPFYGALVEEKPNLNGLRFATFGLGDSFYETFNNGSRIIAEKFIELGAQEVGERGHHDASTGELPGDEALSWIDRLMPLI